MLYPAELLPVHERARRRMIPARGGIMPRSMAELLLASQNPGKLEEMRAARRGAAVPRDRPARDRHRRGARGDRRELPRERAHQGARLRAPLGPAHAWPTTRGSRSTRWAARRACYSSRFGGEGASDLERNRLLLEKLAGVPPERRGARFTSAVAVARDGAVLFEAEEHVDGRDRGGDAGRRTASATTRSSSTRRSAGPSARCSGPRRTASATAARPSRACEPSSRGWATPAEGR